ncbi:MAG: MOSC domain-containing protein [Micromonosporaceae bacterium]|nr:MOSC domain-containing protein [Micromonosporaceae bacterium]
MRLVSLHVYPVKGCHRADLATAEVQPWGLAGDRRWMPVDDDGKMVSQREEPRLALVQPSIVDGELVLAAPGMPEVKVPAVAGGQIEVDIWKHRLPASPAGAEVDAWFAEFLGYPLRLVWLDDPTRRVVNQTYGEPGDRVSFADGYPLLLTNTASLADLNGWIAAGDHPQEAPLPMTRFRPNVVVDGAPAWAEDGWIGRRIRIGEVVFRAAKPSDRCVMTTQDQETGAKGREPLRTLARFRNVNQLLLFGTNLIPDGTGALHLGDPVEVVG